MSNLFARDDVFFTSTGHLSPRQFNDSYGYDYDIGSLNKITLPSDADIKCIKRGRFSARIDAGPHFCDTLLLNEDVFESEKGIEGRS